MKKTISLIAIAIMLFTSWKNEENASTIETKNPDQFGVMVKKSANIEMVKKLIAMAEKSDFAISKPTLHQMRLFMITWMISPLTKTLKCWKILKLMGWQFH